MEEEAAEEILDLLQTLGDQSPESQTTEIRGLLVAQTTIDPFLVVKKLKELVITEPWQVRYVLRVIPVENVVPTDLAAIKKIAKELAVRMNSNDTFRITVEKRHSSLTSMQIIDSIAAEIKNKVNLEEPDWIVLVEIVGTQTGVSIITSDQIFSSIIAKRNG